MKLASFHPSDTKNFEVASRFLEKFCTAVTYISGDLAAA
jgi:hypothetical protein